MLSRAQIERGTVRVGNVEHLGRLCDRDSSIDRDSVMVALELAIADAAAFVPSVPSTSTRGFPGPLPKRPSECSVQGLTRSSSTTKKGAFGGDGSGALRRLISSLRRR